jgi:hypothetical protein
MTSIQKGSRKLRVFFHSVGLSCVGGAIFLQMLMFTDMLEQGYFRAIEQNLVVLWFEMFLTIFALIYFLFMYARFVISTR